jgi:hypothetical protein
MAKRFFYVCLGILCLVITYHVGADRARGEWNPSGGWVIGVAFPYVWNTNGEAWEHHSTYGWRTRPEVDLPVPVDQVAILSEVTPGNAMLVTVTDEVWRLRNDTIYWSCLGSPCGPVPLQADSWGKVKDRYRD